MAADGEHQGVIGLLTALCRELVASPGCDGCLASRVVGDVLISVADYAPDGRSLQLGHGYLVPDYPETKAVLETRQPRALDLADADVDPGEAAVLRELGFQALAMIPLEAFGETWALVELYRAGETPFSADDVDAAAVTVARFARLLAELLSPPSSG